MRGTRAVVLTSGVGTNLDVIGFRDLTVNAPLELLGSNRHYSLMHNCSNAFTVNIIGSSIWI